MQGQDGKTFRTEAAKTLLALTQDASQVDALVDGGAQAHAVATALARTREGARDGLAALANALARANAKGERPADALAVAVDGATCDKRVLEHENVDGLEVVDLPDVAQM